MEQRNKDHFLTQYIKQLGMRGCWDPAELPAPQMGRRRSSLHYISLFQARNLGVLCLVWDGTPGHRHSTKDEVVCPVIWILQPQLSWQSCSCVTHRSGRATTIPTPLCPRPGRASSAGVSCSLALRHPFRADNGVSHLSLLLINEFLKYLYRPSLGPKYWWPMK